MSRFEKMLTYQRVSIIITHHADRCKDKFGIAMYPKQEIQT